MGNYVYYRLPYATQYVKIEQLKGEPEQLMSVSDLNGKSGFVFAPFMASQLHPIMLMRPDAVKVIDIPEGAMSMAKELREEGSDIERSAYGDVFSLFVNKIKEGQFKKIVLARCVEVDSQISSFNQLLSAFLKACQLYPRLFVALVSMPACGTWLMATPEVLLERVSPFIPDGRASWRTMAMAGTMKLQGDQLRFDVPLGNVSSQQISWTTKNIQEQRYDANYIKDCLKKFTNDISEEGPYTSRAANLVHLRSDFYFTTENHDMVGDLLNEIHPTPAICGIPKEAARLFILDNESMSRQYYGGFVGPLNMHESTSLYVTLRCMQVCEDKCRLYAGGGLLKNSTEQKEWEETEVKLETMLNLVV